MPALIIQKNPDGTVLIAAPAQIPPELMQGAQSVASIEDAAKTVSEVLGDDGQGGDDSAVDGQPEPDADDQGAAGTGPASVMGAPADQTDSAAQDAAMGQGFTSVKGRLRR